MPSVPAVDPAALPLVVLTAVAAALLAVGVAGFRRRDVPSLTLLGGVLVIVGS